MRTALKIIILIVIFSYDLYSQDSISGCNLRLKFKNGKLGYVNETGKKVIDFQYDYAEEFQNGLAMVRVDGKNGYINCSGIQVIKAIFDDASSFQDGTAKVTINQKAGIIDLYGNFIVEPQYEYIGQFIDGYARVKKENYYGLIDQNGNLLRDEMFLFCDDFHDGFVMVQAPNRDSTVIMDNDQVTAYLDKKGVILGDHLLSSGTSFENGSAKVAFNGEVYYLDSEGKLSAREAEECDDALFYLQKAEVEGNETMPEFPGGDNARMKFLQENVKYPHDAREKGISGIVYVTFIISKDGKVIRPEILRGIHPSLNTEAIRVISNFPDWKPATLNGDNVCVRFNMPIKFTLAGREKYPGK